MSPSQQAKTAGHRRAIQRQFIWFALIAFLVFLGVAAAVIIPQIRGTFQTYLDRTNRTMLASEVADLRVYLHDRIVVLQDSASRPEVTTMALLADTENLDAIGVLNETKLLGETVPLLLFAIDGSLLYQSQPVPEDIRSELAPLVQTLLTQSDQQMVALTSIEGTAHVLMAVPVMYGGGAEGVLAAVAPLRMSDVFAAQLFDIPTAIRLRKDGTEVSWRIDEIQEPYSQFTLIEPYGIELELLIDREPVVKRESELIRNYGLSIAIAAAVSFGLIIFVGHRLLVAPYQRLMETEQELSERRRDLELVFDNVPVRIWYKDDKNNIRRLNKEAARAMNSTIEEVRGKNMAELTPEIADILYQEDMEILASGEGRRGMIENYRVLGDKNTWLRTDKVPFTNDDTGERGLLVVSQDITDLIEAQRELAASEERFALAAEGSSVGIWDWIDVETDQEYWAPQFYRLLGFENNAFPPSLTAFQELLHPDDVQPIMDALEDHFRTNARYEKEYRLRHKDGSYRWFKATGQAAFDKNGKPTRMVGSIQDIHDLKTAQQDLEAYAAELARSNADLEQFAYVASHDLKAPLRGILNLSEWIEEKISEAADEETLSYLELLRGRILRLDSLLEGLLAYSRVGSRDARIEEIDLQEEVTQIIDLIDARARGFSFDYALPPMDGPKAEIIQVLHNLIGNAVKHNAEAPCRIMVGCSRVADRYVFRVEDDGIGVDENLRGKVFEMFQTLRPRDQVEGSGMGLAIVKKTVNRLGGEIWMETGSTGKGVAVCYSLPVFSRSDGGRYAEAHTA